MEKIALVTGAYRGIGFEICRQLAEKGIKVILSARNEETGKIAAEKLNVIFHQLDITNEVSIEKIKDFIEKKFGKLDILINNAGIMIDHDIHGINTDIDKVKETFDTNTLGPLRLCKSLFPLLKKSDNGRIVNISSGMGALNDMGSYALAYRISKAALNAVTKILASELPENIKVNSMCPGWVRTDMGGPNATRSVKDGADTAVWLATASNVSTGKFYRDRREIEW